MHILTTLLGCSILQVAVASPCMIQSLIVALAIAPQVPLNERVQNNLTPTGFFLKPLGKSVETAVAPLDMALHPNGKWLYIKAKKGLTVVDTASMKAIQELTVPGGASHTGVVTNGSSLYLSNAASQVYVGDIDFKKGTVKWARTLEIPKPKIGGEAVPAGMALANAGDSIYIVSSRGNEVIHLNSADGELFSRWETDIAPYEIALSNNEEKIYVSCWGGKKPGPGAKTAVSGGSEIEVDERGVVKSASLAIHDERTGQHVSVGTGLQPSDIAVASDGRIFVANANNDTVTEITPNLKRAKAIVVKPDFNLPPGTSPSGMTLTGDHLFVACGGNNAVGVIRIKGTSKLLGFLPTGWYPTAVSAQGDKLYVSNLKGSAKRSGASLDFAGSIQKVNLNELKSLQKHTVLVNKLNDTEAISNSGEEEEEESVEEHEEPLVPLPDRLGERTSIDHVVYIVKEGSTYDRVFGDLKQGRGNAKLTAFGRNVTPNHHALAEQFVLLDNFYRNGATGSAGLAWSLEGSASSFLERSVSRGSAGYDPLSTTSSGHIWDNALLSGRTFRNYGLFGHADTSLTRGQILDLWKAGKSNISFNQNIPIERLKRHTSNRYPGWNLHIPDALRADIFVKDVAQFKKAGYFPNLTTIYLPQNRTAGNAAGQPTPQSMVADNDAALGRCIEALSNSPYWKKMAIFVIEGSSQGGADHVDPLRSTCLIVSPFTQTGKVVKTFYNQASVLASMQRMLSLAPMNQMDGRARLMYDCFREKGNFKPYKARPSQIPMTEVN